MGERGPGDGRRTLDVDWRLVVGRFHDAAEEDGHIGNVDALEDFALLALDGRSALIRGRMNGRGYTSR